MKLLKINSRIGTNLMRLGLSLLIVSELGVCRNPHGSRFRSVRSIGQMAQFILGGQPAPNHPLVIQSNQTESPPQSQSSPSSVSSNQPTQLSDTIPFDQQVEPQNQNYNQLYYKASPQSTTHNHQQLNTIDQHNTQSNLHQNNQQNFNPDYQNEINVNGYFQYNPHTSYGHIHPNPSHYNQHTYQYDGSKQYYNSNYNQHTQNSYQTPAISNNWNHNNNQHSPTHLGTSNSNFEPHQNPKPKRSFFFDFFKMMSPYFQHHQTFAVHSVGPKTIQVQPDGAGSLLKTETRDINHMKGPSRLGKITSYIRSILPTLTVTIGDPYAVHNNFIKPNLVQSGVTRVYPPSR